MMFMGGPPTVGGGAIVGRARSEDIRSHTDLAKDRAPLFKSACSYYGALGDRLAANSHVVDVFACSLDQVMRGVGEEGRARGGWGGGRRG